MEILLNKAQVFKSHEMDASALLSYVIKLIWQNKFGVGL